MKELYFRLFLASGYPDDEKLGREGLGFGIAKNFSSGDHFFENGKMIALRLLALLPGALPLGLRRPGKRVQKKGRRFL